MLGMLLVLGIYLSEQNRQKSLHCCFLSLYNNDYIVSGINQHSFIISQFLCVRSPGLA